MTKYSAPLVTSLIDAVVERVTRSHPEYPPLWPSKFQPNASGEYIATVQAAWITEDDDLRLAVTDPFGNTGLVWFTQVKLLKGGVV